MISSLIYVKKNKKNKQTKGTRRQKRRPPRKGKDVVVGQQPADVNDSERDWLSVTSPFGIESCPIWQRCRVRTGVPPPGASFWKATQKKKQKQKKTKHDQGRLPERSHRPPIAVAPRLLFLFFSLFFFSLVRLLSLRLLRSSYSNSNNNNNNKKERVWP